MNHPHFLYPFLITYHMDVVVSIPKAILNDGITKLLMTIDISTLSVITKSGF